MTLLSLRSRLKALVGVSSYGVVAVDLNEDFFDREPSAKLPIAGSTEIIPGIREFLTELTPSEGADFVLFTSDEHEPGYEEPVGDGTDNKFPVHCEKGTPGVALVAGDNLVESTIPCFTMAKNVFDMWQEPHLTLQPCEGGEADYLPGRDAFFASVRDGGVFGDRQSCGAADVNILVIFGVAADFCVKYAIAGALKRGFKVIVLAPLTKGIVRQMEQVCQEDFAEYLATGQLVVLN